MLSSSIVGEIAHQLQQDNASASILSRFASQIQAGVARTHVPLYYEVLSKHGEEPSPNWALVFTCIALRPDLHSTKTPLGTFMARHLKEKGGRRLLLALVNSTDQVLYEKVLTTARRFAFIRQPYNIHQLVALVFHQKGPTADALRDQIFMDFQTR